MCQLLGKKWLLEPDQVPDLLELADALGRQPFIEKLGIEYVITNQIALERREMTFFKVVYTLHYKTKEGFLRGFP